VKWVPGQHGILCPLIADGRTASRQEVAASVPDIPLKSNPKTFSYNGTTINQKQVYFCVTDFHHLPHNSRVKVTLVARPLLVPVAQKMCKW
jgi:hypothetical protein